METNRYPASEEQIAEAKKLDLLTYLQLYEPDELVHISGNEYCTRSHDSLKISNGKWNWFSNGIGGRSALDYLIKVRGHSFVEAVEKLCGVSISTPDMRRVALPTKTENATKEPFELPAANFTNNVIIDYLCNKRGLPKEIVLSLIQRKLIYETRDHHNVVFVGCDKSGTPRYATLRGCYEKPFRMDVVSSNKAFSFSIPARAPAADIVCVFESAIDAISFDVLKQAHRYAHLLTLAGVAPPKSADRSMRKIPVALEQYLSDYPQIKEVVLCLDNDTAGRKATKEITKLLQDRGYVVHDVPPTLGKDYNEELIARRELKRNKDQCR